MHGDGAGEHLGRGDGVAFGRRGATVGRVAGWHGGNGGLQAAGGEHLLEGGADTVGQASRARHHAVVEGELLVQFVVDFLFIAEGEVVEAGLQQRVRGGEVKDEIDAVELEGQSGKQAGIHQLLRVAVHFGVIEDDSPLQTRCVHQFLRGVLRRAHELNRFGLELLSVREKNNGKAERYAKQKAGSCSHDEARLTKTGPIAQGVTAYLLTQELMIRGATSRLLRSPCTRM